MAVESPHKWATETLTIETTDILDQLRNVFRLAVDNLANDVESAYSSGEPLVRINSIIDESIEDIIRDFDEGYDFLAERRIRLITRASGQAVDVSDEFIDAIDDIKEAQIADLRAKASLWKSSISRTAALDKIPGVVSPGRVGGIISDDADGLIIDAERAGVTYSRVLESASSGALEIDNRGAIVQADDSGWRYLYSGPEDDRNRPHCAKYVHKILTRKEIDEISSEQFYLVGDDPASEDYLPEASEKAPCRHFWVLIDKGE